ncbi:hypothetical protein [uncultured Roseovarius sp.]|uniref:hypothetical protein n=1 Tax=uncultured Roseovarius sp. TaxID=293344 RepID=UPI0026385106|nr:hypothetical protein [uncultured Roseovarius sp.]
MTTIEKRGTVTSQAIHNRPQSCSICGMAIVAAQKMIAQLPNYRIVPCATSALNIVPIRKATKHSAVRWFRKAFFPNCQLNDNPIG